MPITIDVPKEKARPLSGSTLTVSTGYTSIEQEFEERTAKAFRAGADFVFVDSRHHRFQFEAATYCESLGYLQHEYIESHEQQYGQMRWHLTDIGRKEWGLGAKQE